MKHLIQALILSFVALLFISTPILAQTIVIPKPEVGHEQSDFAKDIKEGELSITNDKQAQDNQKGIDQNENEDGQQGDGQDENEDIQLDENVDQDEAQVEQGDNHQTTKQENKSNNQEENDNNVNKSEIN